MKTFFVWESPKKISQKLHEDLFWLVFSLVFWIYTRKLSLFVIIYTWKLSLFVIILCSAVIFLFIFF